MKCSVVISNNIHKPGVRTQTRLSICLGKLYYSAFIGDADAGILRTTTQHLAMTLDYWTSDMTIFTKYWRKSQSGTVLTLLYAICLQKGTPRQQDFCMTIRCRAVRSSRLLLPVQLILPIRTFARFIRIIGIPSICATPVSSLES